MALTSPSYLDTKVALNLLSLEIVYFTGLNLHPYAAGFPSIVQESRSTVFHQIPGTSYHPAPETPLGISGSWAVPRAINPSG